MLVKQGIGDLESFAFLFSFLDILRIFRVVYRGSGGRLQKTTRACNSETSVEKELISTHSYDDAHATNMGSRLLKIWLLNTER